MIYPIIGYGHPTLRKQARPIDKDYPGLDQLIADMNDGLIRLERDRDIDRRVPPGSRVSDFRLGYRNDSLDNTRGATGEEGDEKK